MMTNGLCFIVSISVALSLSACVATGQGGSAQNDAPPQAAAAQPATAGTKQAATQPKQSQKTGVGPGMNGAGEVIDSSKVEDGWGVKVTGLNGVEGEITGKADKKSKFNKLRIGMSMRQVFDSIGGPSDEHQYQTGKAWIPFYGGGDMIRIEHIYGGVGRLVYTTASSFGSDMTGTRLMWIIHNKREPKHKEGK